MFVDLAINPFEADVGAMVALAEAAEAQGFGCVWFADHFSGAVVDRRWSRDPFVVLGAVGARTRRIDLGVLVANITNRHPAQLASAINTVQSLAPGRTRLGVGSGAAPGSRFAVEHDAIAKTMGDAPTRRRLLEDSIGALRAIWSGEPTFDAEVVGFDGLHGVVDGAPCPPVIVGASAWPTIEVALGCADGVNLRRTTDLDELLARVVDVRPDGFEISVLDWFDDVAGSPALLASYAAAGVDRIVLGISPPHDPDRLGRIDLAVP